MIETQSNEEEALQISKVVVSKAEEGHEVKVDLGGDCEGARLHLYGFNFFPHDFFHGLVSPFRFTVNKPTITF